MVGQMLFEFPSANILLHQSGVPLEELDDHDLQLGQGQVLPDAVARPPAEDQRNEVLVLLGLLPLPPLRDELQGPLEGGGIVEAGQPVGNNTSSSVNRNPSKSSIYNNLPIENARGRTTDPGGFGDDAVQIVQLFHLLDCDIATVLDHCFDFCSQSFRNCWPLEDVEEQRSKEVGGGLGPCNHKGLDLVNQFVITSIDLLFFFARQCLFSLDQQKLNDSLLTLPLLFRFGFDLFF
jgi:hypothetical protein